MAAAKSSTIRPRSAPAIELDFWGKNRDAAQAAEETAVANRFDRDVVALTTLTTVANAYFQVLAAQDRLRTAQRNIASATRILDAIKQRLQAGTGTDLDVAQQESVLANQRALVPPLRQTLDQNINALAIAGVAAAGSGARHRRLAEPDRHRRGSRRACRRNC